MKKYIGKELYLIGKNFSREDCCLLIMSSTVFGLLFILPFFISLFLGPENTCPWADPYSLSGKAGLILYYMMLRGSLNRFFEKVSDFLQSCIDEYEQE